VTRVHQDDLRAAGEPVDLLGGSGIGPLWGIASADLNATLLAWPPGHRIAEHVNAELDVLLVVLGGQGSTVVDGVDHALVPGSAILIPQGSRRAIESGDAGLRYLSIHRRRGPLQIDATPQA
jgi:uncharacterized cupin superfamily protein